MPLHNYAIDLSFTLAGYVQLPGMARRQFVDLFSWFASPHRRNHPLGRSGIDPLSHWVADRDDKGQSGGRATCYQRHPRAPQGVPGTAVTLLCLPLRLTHGYLEIHESGIHLHFQRTAPNISVRRGSCLSSDSSH